MNNEQAKIDVSINPENAVAELVDIPSLLFEYGSRRVEEESRMDILTHTSQQAQRDMAGLFQVRKEVARLTLIENLLLLKKDILEQLIQTFSIGPTVEECKEEKETIIPEKKKGSKK